MSEWKGSWKCEKCGVVVPNSQRKTDGGHADDRMHQTTGRYYPDCPGPLLPYDRRIASTPGNRTKAMAERIFAIVRTVPAHDGKCMHNILLSEHCHFCHPWVEATEGSKVVTNSKSYEDGTIVVQRRKD
jgi:hypothetical protein